MTEQSTTFSSQVMVVVNNQGHLSLWPAESEQPAGWTPAGCSGTRQACLDWIQQRAAPARQANGFKTKPATSHAQSLGAFGKGRVHHLFEAQVAMRPKTRAVVFENRALTYQELNSRANQLANALLARGLRAGHPVGLCLERSQDMVVGLLGIHKAGGLYVPLDPIHPAARLQTMVREAGVGFIMTQRKLSEQLDGHEGQVMCLDSDWPEIEEQSEANPDIPYSEASLSHVLYTSGSTGSPKGVLVSQAALTRNILSIGELLCVDSRDIYLQTATLAFTSSLRQILVPLTRGATCLIATPEQRTNPLALFQLIQDQQGTILDSVASFLETCTSTLLCLRPEERRRLLRNRLRLILSSGGELVSSVPQAWQGKLKCPGPSFMNMYGQTETIGNVLVYPLDCLGDEADRLVPLGPPIDGTSLHVLDADMRPVPAGQAAELHIGGLCLAEGYLGQPGLSAEKFVPDPWSDHPGGRLYRTGDRGRCLPDGTLEFLGRIDLQTKVRGYRIELGDIEAALKEHPGVGEAAVAAREGWSSEKRLVAYYTGNYGSRLSVNELRSFLQASLPEYMIPAAYVQLEALPRLPNGKIDRHSLPEPDRRRPDLDQAYIPPDIELHTVLAGLWCDILKLDRAGIKDNFFELGGDSLAAMRLLAELRSRFGVSIAWTRLFEEPTIAAIGGLLEKSGRLSGSAPGRGPEQEGGREVMTF